MTGRRATRAQWKMTRTQDQVSKTGLAAPSQEPGVGEEHLLAIEDLAPGLQTRSRTRPPPFEGPETVEELDDDDDDDLLEETKNDASLSELDEALSDGASSYGDESPPNLGPPNLQELIRLGREHCRTSCTLTDQDGVKTPSVCGKKVVDCYRHGKTRLGFGTFRYTIGSYSKVPVSRGFKEHGLAPPRGLFFTDAEIKAAREDEKKAMSHLVQGMMEAQTDEEEMEELARDLRVKFAAPTQVAKEKPSRHQSDSTEALRKAMAAGSLGPK